MSEVRTIRVGGETPYDVVVGRHLLGAIPDLLGDGVQRVLVVHPAALATSWVDRTVADTDGYVDAVAPLANEEAVQDAVTVRVRAAVVSALDVPPGLAEDAVASAVTLAVRRVVESDALPPLWRASNEVAHRSLVGVLSQPEGSGGSVTIDVTPVVEAVLDQLPSRLVSGSVEVPPATFSVASTERVDDARGAYQAVQGLGMALQDLVARHGDPSDPETAYLLHYLDLTAKRNLVLTFGGGVNEIQRELIAQFGLGLPRVPR